MRRLGARLLIAAMERAARWSQAARSRLGAALGTLLWWVALPRRRVMLTNLRLCFPEWSEARRAEVARACLKRLGRAFVDHGVLATAGAESIERYVRVEGAAALRSGPDAPLIVLAPHFAGLDAAGVRLNRVFRGVSIYARSRNPEWDRWLLDIRSRFSAPLLIAREGFDLRAVVRAMREGMPFYYLPDQDAGPRNGVFAPFFGVPAATLPMVSRLARLTGATVVLAVTEMTDEGYVLHVEGPWEDFPGASVEEDTARMNREIERWVRRLPDQYLWTHKRFKTRPAGEPGLY